MVKNSTRYLTLFIFFCCCFTDTRTNRVLLSFLFSSPRSFSLLLVLKFVSVENPNSQGYEVENCWTIFSGFDICIYFVLWEYIRFLYDTERAWIIYLYMFFQCNKIFYRTDHFNKFLRMVTRIYLIV